MVDRISALMYLSEVRDLVWGIRDALAALAEARRVWMEQHRISSEEAASPPESFNRERFQSALETSRGAQTDAFLMTEALMARWARLSLLFFPLVPKREAGSWRDQRGEVLRSLIAVPDDSVLADREARDAWMHFDERMDEAAQAGRLGNRQQFVDSTGVASALNVCPRVIDMEGGVLHFRKRDGQVAFVTFDEMANAVDQVEEGLSAAGPRAVELLPERVRPTASA